VPSEVDRSKLCIFHHIVISPIVPITRQKTKVEDVMGSQVRNTLEAVSCPAQHLRRLGAASLLTQMHCDWDAPSCTAHKVEDVIICPIITLDS